MEDTQTTQEMQTNSTVIDQEVDGVKSGGGKPPVETPPKQEATRKTESARESLEAEAKKISESPNEDDEDDKPAKEDTKSEDKKPVKEKVEESARKADASEQEAKTPKPPEGRRIIEAPARFLPRSRELWKSTPREVQEEWSRYETERNTELNQYREAHTFREGLKDFEDMARSKGVDFKQALTNYVDIERKFSEDPAQGFRQLLQNTNMTPQQAIGHVLRAFGATPAQLVQHIQASPHEYTSLAQRPAPQVQQQAQPQISPEVKALQEQIAQMRAEQVANSVIAPFAQDYPEYYEYEDAIAKVLDSGIIEQLHGNGLSSRDKLEAALLFAAPHLSKRGQKVEAADDDSVQSGQDEAPVQLVQGGKSVRSSVGGVTETSEPERKMSMRDMLEEEARKISRRA